MNHLLKKATKILLKSNNIDNSNKIVYVNFNYFIDPKIVETSIPYFAKKVDIIEPRSVTKAGEGYLTYNLGEAIIDTFVINGKLHAFINTSLVSIENIYEMMVNGRYFYMKTFNELKEVDENIKHGKIYINTKVLYVEDVENFIENAETIVSTKYDAIIDGNI